jgi:hypothetical protein
MIAGMLRRFGLYTGWEIEKNAEAVFFLKRNEKLLNICGGSWENPSVIRNLLDQPKQREYVAKKLKKEMNSFHFMSFLGPKKFVSLRGADNIDFPWGWKDPRNVYLLPLWLDIFPNAKVIHICRNGIDVACSLRNRASRELKIQQSNFEVELTTKKGTWERIWGRIGKTGKDNISLSAYNSLQHFRSRIGSLSTYDGIKIPRTVDLEEGFKLWHNYIEKYSEQSASIENECLTVKYEDFISEPEENLLKLIRFCELDTDLGSLKSVCQSINAKRRFAFISDREAMELYQKVRQDKWMNGLGYGDIDT